MDVLRGPEARIAETHLKLRNYFGLISLRKYYLSCGRIHLQNSLIVLKSLINTLVKHDFCYYRIESHKVQFNSKSA